MTARTGTAMRAATPGRSTLHSGQATLFDTGDLLPDGLRFTANLITPAEEQALLALAATLPLREARYKQYTARRRVFAYGGHRADEDEDDDIGVDGVPAGMPRPLSLVSLPPPMQALRQRLATFAGVPEADFVHVMVAEYQTGTPLGWHRDAPHYELIAGVSLGSPARLRFRPWPHGDTPVTVPDDVLALELAPRSAYVMQGTARWGWQHSVPPVPALRHSVTMRTARTVSPAR